MITMTNVDVECTTGLAVGAVTRESSLSVEDDGVLCVRVGVELALALEQSVQAVVARVSIGL